MKIKSLLIGMLACTALVGCSDDDVLNNNELENQQAEKMRAYMTFSIASSTNSSRGVGEGTTDGDNHGNQEHSGHESAGIAAENTVNDILVVFYNTQGNDGFCDLYTMGSSDDNLTYNGYSTKFEEKSNSNNEKSYELSQPFALNSLGKYNVLVIVNPAEAIKSKTANNKTDAEKIYNEIIESYADEVTEVTGTNYSNFMMANRKKVVINVTENNNDPSNPAQYMEGSSEDTMEPAYIEVERVASKITFRPTNNNSYNITETTYSYDIENGSFWYQDPTTKIYNYLTNLFKAQDIDKKVYWVYVNADGTTKRYKINESFKGSADDLRGEAEGSLGDGMYEGELKPAEGSTSNTVQAKVVVDVDDEEAKKTIVYVGTKITVNPTVKNYTIKLEKYALVNLNNSVYYVRHTSENPATAKNTDAWGGNVSTSRYLIEPNTAAKSKTVNSWGNPISWQLEGDAGDYYNDDFVKVTNDIAEKGTASTYLKEFGTENHGTVDGKVTPSDTGASAEVPEVGKNGSVGNLLGYCMENSMLANNQNALTSTSIIFEAQIYDAENKPVKYMIEFKGNFYGNFASLVEATKSGDDITTSQFWAFTDADYANLSETEKQTWATNLANLDATLYQDGKCYYFSSQIEHFDNDEIVNGEFVEKGKGVMENAIMRNNIYSLAVTSVNGFGFSKLNLQSGVLNEESTTEQEKVYLTMKAKILPWIVRFNNITF